MIRLILLEIAVFTLPFVAYRLYMAVLNKQEAGSNFWKDAPIFNLSLIGFGLVAAGILGYGLYWS